MTLLRPLLLFSCCALMLVHSACATGGYAGPQIVVSSKGEVSLEIMATAGTGPLLTNPTTHHRTSVIRWLGLDAFIGYNFHNRKLVGGFGNALSLASRPAFALSGHESRIGTRFRFGGGHGFQGGFHVHYAHARVVYAERNFPVCAAEGSESQSWMGFAIGAEVLWGKRANNRGQAMTPNLVVGTVFGHDKFYQGGFMLSACGEPAE